jgi:hypothetical protein
MGVSVQRRAIIGTAQSVLEVPMLSKVGLDFSQK